MYTGAGFTTPRVDELGGRAAEPLHGVHCPEGVDLVVAEDGRVGADDHLFVVFVPRGGG